MNPEMRNLKAFLDAKSNEYNSPDFIACDPVSVPHHFNSPPDIEIAGFLSATLSWGQRPMIIAKAKALTGFMDNEPYNFLTQAPEKEFERFSRFVYRTFNGDDCLFFMQSLRSLYREYESLEEVFAEGYRKEDSVRDGIIAFRKKFLEMPHFVRSAKHIADPGSGSAAKRLNMFLRWMVRDDGRGVDFGLWKKIDPARLMCPLDVHSGRVARSLGLLTRKQNDWKAVEELTANLRLFDIHDPVKYDFALFGTGVNEKHGNEGNFKHTPTGGNCREK